MYYSSISDCVLQQVLVESKRPDSDFFQLTVLYLNKVHNMCQCICNICVFTSKAPHNFQKVGSALLRSSDSFLLAQELAQGIVGNKVCGQGERRRFRSMAGHDSGKMLSSLLVPSLCYFSIFQRYRRYSAASPPPIYNFSFSLNSVLPQGVLLNSYYTLDVVLHASAIKYNCHLLVKSCSEKNWHTCGQAASQKRRQISKIAVPAPTTWGRFKKQHMPC